MSADGLRQAVMVGRVQPMRARFVAAELRNAITPASLAVAQIEDAELAADVRASVEHVLAIADALEPRETAVERQVRLDREAIRRGGSHV